jgi:hypothetical protein
MERRATELATFLLWLVDEHRIPSLSRNRAHGGVVLLGWGVGAATALALLGQTDTLPQGTIRRLEHYLKRILAYGQRSACMKDPDLANVLL